MTSSLGITAFMATSYLDIKANKLNNTLRRALKLIGRMTKSSDTAAEKSAFKSEKQNRAARDSQERLQQLVSPKSLYCKIVQSRQESRTG